MISGRSALIDKIALVLILSLSIVEFLSALRESSEQKHDLTAAHSGNGSSSSHMEVNPTLKLSSSEWFCRGKNGEMSRLKKDEEEDTERGTEGQLEETTTSPDKKLMNK